MVSRADLANLVVRAELHTYTVCVCAMPRNGTAGALVCFADDSSQSVSDQNIEKLKISIELQNAASSSPHLLTSSILQVNGVKESCHAPHHRPA